MKKLHKCVHIAFTIIGIATLSSCAAGAATAAYSVHAKTADGLTSEAEQRIVNRAKNEMRAELSGPDCQCPPQGSY